jgi:hypothetical protein
VTTDFQVAFFQFAQACTNYSGQKSQDQCLSAPSASSPFKAEVAQ